MAAHDEAFGLGLRPQKRGKGDRPEIFLT